MRLIYIVCDWYDMKGWEPEWSNQQNTVSNNKSNY